jgi:chromatin remodeling complex protein RSC6
VKDKLFKDGFRDVIASTRLDDVFYSDGRINPIDRVKMDELTKDLDGHIFECDSKLVKYTVEDYVVKII